MMKHEEAPENVQTDEAQRDAEKKEATKAERALLPLGQT
jgi:hypothetical protein